MRQQQEQYLSLVRPINPVGLEGEAAVCKSDQKCWALQRSDTESSHVLVDEEDVGYSTSNDEGVVPDHQQGQGQESEEIDKHPSFK